MIERWTPKLKQEACSEGLTLRMWTDKDGDYVLLSDHLAATQEKDKEVARVTQKWKEANDDLGEQLRDDFGLAETILKLKAENTGLRKRLTDLEARMKPIREVFKKWHKSDGDYGETEEFTEYYDQLTKLLHDCWAAIKAANGGGKCLDI